MEFTLIGGVDDEDRGVRKGFGTRLLEELLGDATRGSELTGLGLLKFNRKNRRGREDESG